MPDSRTTRLAFRLVRGFDVARALAAGIVLAALARVGADLDRAVPGPAALRAGAIAVLAGLGVAGVRLVFDLSLRAALARAGVAPASVLSAYSLAAPLFVVAGGFSSWAILAATGSLVALPILLPFVLLAINALAYVIGLFADEHAAFEDPVLERRLVRFARDAGIGAIDVRLVGDGQQTSRTIGNRAPDVQLGRRRGARVLRVPREVIDATPAILETRLARAIVRVRRREEQRIFLMSWLVQIVGVGGAAGLAGHLLRRLAGSSDYGSPGFVPMAVLVIGLAQFSAAPILKAVGRREERHQLREVLDLTRNPEEAHASVAWDLSQATMPILTGRLSRLLTGRLSAAECAVQIRRWQASQHACLLVTDIVGSTDTLNRIGDKAWYDVLSDHDHLVRQVLREHEGEVIEKPGDGFFVAFFDTGRALLAAIEIQRRLRRPEVAPSVPVAVRIGLHTGEIIRHGREVAGREVHLAARIGGMADAGEILVSDEVQREVATSPRFRFGPPRQTTFKGFEGLHSVRPLLWDDSPDRLPEPAPRSSAHAGP